MTSLSEVARIRHSIQEETEASLRGLYGLAIVAAHEVIEKRIEQGAERLNARLAQLVAEGKEDQARLLVMDENIWDAMWMQEVQLPTDGTNSKNPSCL